MVQQSPQLASLALQAYDNLSAAVYIKDLKGKYLWANSYFIRTSIGAQSFSEVQDKEDYDLPWHSYADELRANDQSVFENGESLSSYERIIRHDGTKVDILSRKEPLFEQKNLVALLGFSFALPSIKRAPLFTPREHEVLSFVSRGYTDKEIAKNLRISPRTVEAHINNAKQKLAVRTRSELIARFVAQSYK